MSLTMIMTMLLTPPPPTPATARKANSCSLVWAKPASKSPSATRPRHSSRELLAAKDVGQPAVDELEGGAGDEERRADPRRRRPRGQRRRHGRHRRRHLRLVDKRDEQRHRQRRHRHQQRRPRQQHPLVSDALRVAVVVVRGSGFRGWRILGSPDLGVVVLVGHGAVGVDLDGLCEKVVLRGAGFDMAPCFGFLSLASFAVPNDNPSNWIHGCGTQPASVSGCFPITGYL
ncbi:hypothetical protein B0T26DRAFT_353435 [Lasiosphaeria miniovina]|uniref:Uncharacterized protein n=1 Tax=Lasiosphaeria miniovina TaxID=1954250 RepID=A0AA40DTR8_9PEZI|nr:uncharacterized protein B0T26DRAFT_353435 [Lasiosphaeria miniovina]KAK0713047.1 hypothetical protein B0T26DRAFT_353435 [Lasiosphaeria miniovina]